MPAMIAGFGDPVDTGSQLRPPCRWHPVPAATNSQCDGERTASIRHQGLGATGTPSDGESPDSSLFEPEPKVRRSLGAAPAPTRRLVRPAGCRRGIDRRPPGRRNDPERGGVQPGGEPHREAVVCRCADALRPARWRWLRRRVADRPLPPRPADDHRQSRRRLRPPPPRSRARPTQLRRSRRRVHPRRTHRAQPSSWTQSFGQWSTRSHPIGRATGSA
jgi:hypothetical protein